jgi:hypothetical protein
MPGLLRGMARTAVIAGTATTVSNRVSRRQGQRWAQQDQAQYDQQEQYAEPAPAPAAPAVSTTDRVQQLKELGALRDQGILTPEEFDVEKAKILNS